MLQLKIKSVQDLVYNHELRKKINTANILIIGVGGIGCELLKVLTNSGYRKLTILDFDTIEVTNLNRQFYFRREHVGMSKAQIGKESVLKKDPTLDITAIHDTIFADRFDIVFYQSFDLIFCALDNNAAREHLGRMCCMSNRVMIDAGTEGFNGQVAANIRKCNNCNPSKAPVSFAVCTIRATPSEPIHCVVYGMSLFGLLFGPKDPKNHLSGFLEFENLFETLEEDQLRTTAIKLFNQLFHESIQKMIFEQVSPGSQPNKFPLSFDDALKIQDIYCSEEMQQQLKSKSPSQQLLPLSSYAELFVNSFVQIAMRDQNNKLTFEKDDSECIQFVTSVTNMRTFNFTQKYKTNEEDKFKYMSEFEVKVLGGKVIPAIASTNAMAAAMQSLESYKVLDKNYQSLKQIWINKYKRESDDLIQYIRLDSRQLPESRPDCMVCSKNIVYLFLNADFETTQFSQITKLLEKLNIEKKELSYGIDVLDINDINEMFLTEINPDDSLKSIILYIQDKVIEKFEYWRQGFIYHIILVHKKDSPLKLFEGCSLDQVQEQRSQVMKLQSEEIRKTRNQLYRKYELR